MNLNKKEIVLVVDDEEDIQELVRYNLESSGYVVMSAGDGEEAIAKANEVFPDIIVLDLMLPGLTGFEACARLKNSQRTRDIPIVMLTAKGDEADIVKGLESGADDYVTKPFSPKVLIARIAALLRRRSKSESEASPLPGLVMDRKKREVSLDGVVLDMTFSEYSILDILLSRGGAVMTRKQIVAAIRGGEITSTERAVDVHITAIRKKLGHLGGKILTVRGVGYRLDI